MAFIFKKTNNTWKIKFISNNISQHYNELQNVSENILFYSYGDNEFTENNLSIVIENTPELSQSQSQNLNQSQNQNQNQNPSQSQNQNQTRTEPEPERT